MFYHQLQVLLLHIKGNTSTSSNISASAGTQNDAESSHDTLDQTAKSTTENSKTGSDATTSRTTGTSVAVSPSKRKCRNLHRHCSKRTANEHSIASSAKELTLILNESLAIQKEQAYQEKERQADVRGLSKKFVQ